MTKIPDSLILKHGGANGKTFMPADYKGVWALLPGL